MERQNDGSWTTRTVHRDRDLGQLDAVSDFCIGTGTIVKKGTIRRTRTVRTTGKSGEAA